MPLYRSVANVPAYYMGAPIATVTGTLTETSLFSIKIPAYAIGKSGSLRVLPLYVYTNSANNKTFRVAWEGQDILNAVVTTSASIYRPIHVMARDSHTSQITQPVSQVNPYGAMGGSPTTLTIDTTQETTLEFFGQLSNVGESITLRAVCIEFFELEDVTSGLAVHPSHAPYVAHVPTSVTGTTTPTVLASVTIPGGTMGPNGALRIQQEVTWTNSANVKNWVITFGGSNIYSRGPTTPSANMRVCHVQNLNSEASQTYFNTTDGDGIGTSSSMPTNTINTANDVVVELVATLSAASAAAGETLTCQDLTIEVLQGVI